MAAAPSQQPLMAVYDRWHKAPKPGDEACSCGTARSPLYPSGVHKKGKRWQVRWRDEAGRQPRRNFDLKVGKNPDIHADAYDAKNSRDLDTGDYIDPSNADITLREYAEDWRKNRKHDTVTAEKTERRLRLHVYEATGKPGRTPKGGVAIGHRRMAELSRRPSLIQAWIKAMPLAEGSRRLVVDDVGAIFSAAMDDGIARRDPTRVSSVQRPGRGRRKKQVWSRPQVAAMRAELPRRYRIVADIGTGTGMRQGEIFGLAVDDVRFLGKDPRISVERQVKVVGNKLHFAPLKNRKPHSAPMGPVLAERLAAHLAEFPAVPVTLPWHDLEDPEKHGTLVTARLVVTTTYCHAMENKYFDREVWNPARIRAGIVAKGQQARQHGCHAMRHTAITEWLAAGIDVARVAEWVGDTPQVIYTTYAHVSPDRPDDDGRAVSDAVLASGACALDVPSEVAE